MFKRIYSIVGAVMGSAVLLAAFLHWASPAAASGLIIVNPGESIQAALDKSFPIRMKWRGVIR